MLVPVSSTIAPMPCSAISLRAFSMRASRSASAIGVALPGNGFSARMDSGSGVESPRPRCAAAGAAYAAAAVSAEA